MNVSLTRVLEGFIAGLVKSGRYNNASEAVREEIRLLQAREERRQEDLRALCAAIAEAETDLAAGRYRDYGSAKELMDDIDPP